MGRAMREQEKQLGENQQRHVWRRAHNRKLFRPARFCSFLPDWQYFARLDGPGRGSQTWQQFTNPAPHLLRGEDIVPAFPQTQFRLNHRTGQSHLMMSNYYKPSPAFKQLKSAHVWFLPQQGLFLKTRAMLRAKAMDVIQGHGSQIHRGVSDPDTPAYARIAIAAGTKPRSLQDGHVQPTSLLDRHLLPPGESHGTIRCLQSLPHSIGTAWTGLGIRSQSGSIFEERTAFAIFRGRRAINTTVAFEAYQGTDERQGAVLASQPDRVLFLIQHNRCFPGQNRCQLWQSRRWHLRGCSLGGDLLLTQDGDPTPGRIGQGDHGQKLPSPGDRLFTRRQILPRQHTVISGRSRMPARNAGGIDSTPAPAPHLLRRQIPHECCKQRVLIDLTIFRRLFPLHPHRSRDFGQRSGLHFRHQGIDGVEQCIFGPQKAIVRDRVTTRLLSVKVHTSFASLLSLVPESYSFWPSFTREIAFWFSVSSNKNTEERCWLHVSDKR